MHLINCETLKLEEFIGSDIPSYAILSHTWGKGEITFADVPTGDLNVESVRSRESFRKTTHTCEQALEHGLKYAWVDTFCIDKSSSAELSESINSMFSWYKNAARCYVYLSDVSIKDPSYDVTLSRWFTRGWTLQELIAPSSLAFYDCNWKWIGMRHDHAERIAEATSINVDVLRHGIYRHPSLASRSRRHVPLSNFCVAQKMSWAAGRQTTREEDVAYSLLGIFEVNMPLLYGEGKRAFQRLQKEIMTNIADESILAWGLCQPFVMSPDADLAQVSLIRRRSGYLAASPQDFRHCGNITLQSQRSSSFSMTNNGLKIRLPITTPMSVGSVSSHASSRTSVATYDMSDAPSICIGILNCTLSSASPLSSDIERGPDPGSHMLGLLLMIRYSTHEPYGRCELRTDDVSGQTVRVDPRLVISAKNRDVTINQEVKGVNTVAQDSQYRYIVKISRSLPGISCVGGTLILQRERDDTTIMDGEAQWDSAKAILSFELNSRFPRTLGYAIFSFTGSSPRDAFIVLANLQFFRGVIYKGSRLTPSQIAALCTRLWSNIQRDGADELQNIVLSSSWLGPIPVTFKIRGKGIHDWNIYELKIAIDSTHSMSAIDSSRVSQRPSPEILPASFSG